MFLTNLWPWNKSKVIQTWNELVDSREDYNNAKFESSHSNSAWEKANIKVSFLNEEIF